MLRLQTSESANSCAARSKRVTLMSARARTWVPTGSTRKRMAGTITVLLRIFGVWVWPYLNSMWVTSHFFKRVRDPTGLPLCVQFASATRRASPRPRHRSFAISWSAASRRSPGKGGRRLSSWPTRLCAMTRIHVKWVDPVVFLLWLGSWNHLFELVYIPPDSNLFSFRRTIPFVNYDKREFKILNYLSTALLFSILNWV